MGREQNRQQDKQDRRQDVQEMLHDKQEMLQDAQKMLQDDLDCLQKEQDWLQDHWKRLKEKLKKFVDVPHNEAAEHLKQKKIFCFSKAKNAKMQTFLVYIHVYLFNAN